MIYYGIRSSLVMHWSTVLIVCPGQTTLVSISCIFLWVSWSLFYSSKGTSPDPPSKNYSSALFWELVILYVKVLLYGVSIAGPGETKAFYAFYFPLRLTIVNFWVLFKLESTKFLNSLGLFLLFFSSEKSEMHYIGDVRGLSYLI